MNHKLQKFIPPIVLDVARRLKQSLRQSSPMAPGSVEDCEKLQWCPILDGPLAGRMVFMNPNAPAYQLEMLQGVFDRSVFEYIDRLEWTGKVIYDIGAHIGYHTLNFAQRVGPEGHVYSFEPHPTHRERIEKNLSRNYALAIRVSLLPFAVGNQNGRLDLFCTEGVESGGSSASFIDGASTPFPRSKYEQYRPISVDVVRLDDLVQSHRCLPPDLIKIDVEGAEGLLIEGAMDILVRYHPLIVMEVHSLPNMMHVTTLLLGAGYTLNILEEEDRRCFVAAEPAESKQPVNKRVRDRSGEGRS